MGGLEAQASHSLPTLMGAAGALQTAASACLSSGRGLELDRKHAQWVLAGTLRVPSPGKGIMEEGLPPPLLLSSRMFESIK